MSKTIEVHTGKRVWTLEQRGNTYVAMRKDGKQGKTYEIGENASGERCLIGEMRPSGKSRYMWRITRIDGASVTQPAKVAKKRTKTAKSDKVRQVVKLARKGETAYEWFTRRAA